MSCCSNLEMVSLTVEEEGVGGVGVGVDVWAGVVVVVVVVVVVGVPDVVANGGGLLGDVS
jgi:hypothetical protein